MTKKKLKKEAKVAYGMLDMMHGHKQQEALDHILKTDQEIGHNPDAWFFDILHTPNQEPTAKEARVFINNFLKEMYPDLAEANINVMMTTDPEKPGARNLMFEIMYKGGTERIKYQDPEAEK